jgi:hypothetical protein
MNEASHHDCSILLTEDMVTTASTAAHYLNMVRSYAEVGDRAGIKHVLKCGAACFRSALKSYNDLVALDPHPEHREAAE